MFEDRYLPADDPEDYELNRGEERKESSRHKHDSSSKHKKKSHHKERSASRERSHKRHKERKQPSPEEVEDGEVLEDGEIAEVAAEGVTAPAAAAAEPAAADEAAAPSAAADDAVAANGKRRSSEDDSAGHKEGKERPSSRPSSRRSNSSRERSRERPKDKEPAAAAAAGSSRERKSSRERSKDPRDKSRDRDRERSKDPRDKSRDRDRERSKDPREKDRDREKERRGRSRERSSSRRARECHGQQQREREREPPSRFRQSSRERPAAAAAAGSDRYQRGSDSSRQYDRDRGRQYDRSRELQARDRDRDRERDSRYRSERDRQYDMSGRGGRGGSRRSSRSRSRGRRGQDYDRERDRDRQYKRGRDERDREDSKRRRRHSSDSEPELELDPTALLEGDALGLTAAQKEDEEQQRRLEESRRRRQEILAKHQQAAAGAAPTAAAAAAAAAAGEAGSQQQQEQQGDGIAAAVEQQQQPAATAAAAAADDDGIATPEGERTSSEDSHNAPGSPVMDIWNQGAAAAGEVSSRAAAGAAGGPDEEQPTSQLPVHLVLPGTEPNMQSERLRVGQGAAAGKSADAPAAAAAATKSAGDAAAADAAEEGGDDMFAAEDDMFAAEGADGAGAALRKGPAVPAGLTDNYDDAEGYYNFQVGEVLDGRYEVFACKGKGVFSTVLRARDTQRQVNAATGQLLPGVGPGPLAPGAEHPEVAIKVIRSNETMSKAAALEQRILRLLAEKDPDNRKHVIRLLRTFEYRQHVCMVFENMDMNLRELTLKYGRNVGLNIQAVAIYAGQLLVALRHLQQCRVLHADIKPDNILVNARRSKVKVCDLGSAMLAGENERTPYLVSRFYRAPEVVLGLAYDFPMDMWSVGCVLYELFTGKILFPGRSNNEMLKLMMDVKGPFPKKMLKKGIFVEKHFEDDTSMSFALIEEDPVTKQPIRRVIPNPTIKHNFSQLLARAEGDRAQLAALADLLEKMLALDPEKRIQADAALRHPFVKPWLPKKKEKGAGAGH